MRQWPDNLMEMLIVFAILSDSELHKARLTKHLCAMLCPVDGSRFNGYAHGYLSGRLVDAVSVTVEPTATDALICFSNGDK